MPVATHDGEVAPEEGELPNDYHLNRIIGVGNRLYIAAEGGQLYRSDDRGATWRILPSPYEGSFFGLVPIRGEGLLAFGLRGHLYRSADAGETWSKLESHTTAMLTDGVAINDLRVVIGGLAGVLLVSRDAGETFRITQQDDRKGVSALMPGPAGAVVVAGEGGVRVLRLDAAATISRVSNVGARLSASPNRTKITHISTRTSARRMASSMAIRRSSSILNMSQTRRGSI